MMKATSSRSSLGLWLGLAVVACGVRGAWADYPTWTNAAGGDFSTAGNWDGPQQVPGPSDAPEFRTLGLPPYTITWSQNVANSGLYAGGNNTMLWDFQGYTYTVASPIYIGSGGLPCNLTVSNGTFAVTGVQSLFMRQLGAYFIIKNALVSGYQLLMDGGIDPGPIMIIDGTNSRATFSGAAYIGKDFSGGSGTLIITNGGTLELPNGNLGVNIREVGTGRVIISGTNSVCKLGGASGVGGGPGFAAGAGYLTIENGGLFTNSSTTAARRYMDIWSNGVVTLNNGSLLMADTNSEIAIRQGILQGSGNIKGYVINAGGTVRPGNTNAAGVLQCAGAFNNGATNSAVSGTLQMELGGTNTTQYDRLAIDGTLQATGTLSVVLIDDFTPKCGDTFKLFDATAINGAFTNIVLPALASPLAWNTNLLYTAGQIFCELAPTTAYQIWTNALGGDFSTPGNWDLNCAPRTCDAPVFGAIGLPPYTVTWSRNVTNSGLYGQGYNKIKWNFQGYTYTLGSPIYIGNAGQACDLTVSNGTLNVTGPDKINMYYAGTYLKIRGAIVMCNLIRMEGGAGLGPQLIVDGPSSRATASDGAYIAADYGSATLIVTNGGAIELPNGCLGINIRTIGTGRVIISGTNSVCKLGGASGVGGMDSAAGPGYLTLENGGLFTNSSTTAAGRYMNIWSNGVVTLNNGRLLMADTNAEINVRQGILQGSGNIKGYVINEGGTLQPGNTNAAGLLQCVGTFNNGATNSSISGTLQMELGGTNTTQYDRLAIDGTLRATGTLSVALINGFTPDVGDIFKLFDATTISGAFTNIVLPTLVEPKFWDTNQLDTSGKILCDGPRIPTGVSASDGTYTNKIMVTWNTASNAVGYKIWRGPHNDTTTAAIVGDTTAVQWDDTTVNSAAYYYYWVQSTNGAYAGKLSIVDSGWRSPAPPTVHTMVWVNASGGNFTNKVNWEPTIVPTNNDVAVFNITSTPYTVTWSAAITNHAFRVNAGNVTWDLGGEAYYYGNTLTSWVGSAAGQADLTVMNGFMACTGSTYRPVLIAGTGTVLRVTNADVSLLYPNIGTQTMVVAEGTNTVLRSAGYIDTIYGALIVTNNALVIATNGLRLRSGGSMHISGDASGKTNYIAFVAFDAGGLMRLGEGAIVRNIYTNANHATTVSGALTLDNARLFNSDNNATMTLSGASAYLQGSGQLEYMLVRNSGGKVWPGGSNSAGILYIQGGYSNASSASIIAIELGGTATNQYDRLFVSAGAGGGGTLWPGGALNVSLINGFMPTYGDTFKILDFASRTGAFSSIVFPKDTLWDTNQLYATGEIRCLGLTNIQYYGGSYDGAHSCISSNLAFGTMLISDFSDPAAWEFEAENPGFSEGYQVGGNPSTIGQFTLTPVCDPVKGNVAELTLVPQANLPKIMGQTAYLRLKNPATISSEVKRIGIWVKGNSCWGRVYFEFTDVYGEVFRTQTTCLDPNKLSYTTAINFDDWCFISQKLPVNQIDDYTNTDIWLLHAQKANNANWRNLDADGIIASPNVYNRDGDSIAQFPITVTRIGIMLRNWQVYLPDMLPAQDLSIRLGNFLAGE